jgi:hypothetical protein
LCEASGTDLVTLGYIGNASLYDEESMTKTVPIILTVIGLVISHQMSVSTD